MEKKKIGVIFPGMGYHSDKPVLYYGKKLLLSKGYDVQVIEYGEIPSGKEHIKEAIQIGYSAALPRLLEILSEDYEDIVFIGKSIGTVIAARIASEKSPSLHSVNSIQSVHPLQPIQTIRQILATPIPETIPYLLLQEDSSSASQLVLHGNADPYMDTDTLTSACKRMNIPHFLFQDANHSLEIPVDIPKTAEYISEIAKIYSDFIDKV